MKLPYTRQVNSKVVIIGLDGLSFNYLKPLLKNNKLPAINHLMKGGCYGILNSTFPPMTPVAWTTMYTGKNPGKNGIYSWLRIDPKNKTILPVQSNMSKQKPLWILLNEYGKSTGIINAPLTYPAPIVDGFFITGFDNPFDSFASHEGIAYPLSIVNELAKKGIDYDILPSYLSNPFQNLKEIDVFFRNWKLAEKKRTISAKYLLNKFHPDFFFIVYNIFDYFAHLDKTGIKTDKALILLDKLIGELIQTFGPNTNFLIISDHGSTRLKKYVFLQHWLLEKGLLSFNQEVSEEHYTLIGKKISSIFAAILPQTLNKSLENASVKLLEKLDLKILHIIEIALCRIFPKLIISDSNIDWDNTIAFTIGSYGEIYINWDNKIYGKEFNKYDYTLIVSRLIDCLKILKDPENGKLLFSRVMRKEEVYWGGEISSAPDIICILRDQSYYFMRYNYHMRPNTTLKMLAQRDYKLISKISSSDDFIGDHTSQGIFVANGPNVIPSKKVNIHLHDIAPTILALYGINVPADFDGEILSEYFMFPDVRINPIKSEVDMSEEVDYNDSQKKVIRLKLKNYGYNV